MLVRLKCFLVRLIRTVLLLFLVSLSVNAIAQNFSKDEVLLLRKVERIVKENHVNYETGQSKLDKRFTPQLLKELDPDAKYLTTKEIKLIKELFRDFNSDYDYTKQRLDSVYNLYESRLEVTLELLNTVQELNFFKKDSLLLSVKPDSIIFAANDSLLLTSWSRELKYQVLSRHKNDSLLKNMEPQNINLYLNSKATFEIDAEKCKIESLLNTKVLKDIVLSAYLRAYCRSFDPHSDYFSLQEERSFLAGLSSEYYGTGITYAEQGNKFFVAQISPFSDASNFNELAEGDEITGIVEGGELISINCISGERISELFYGDRNSTLELEILSKTDKQYRRYRLNKSMVRNNLNHTYAFVLQNRDLKIGYIQFPAFYAKMTISSRSSAEDLALILLALKKMEVEGIILDLRNNGGGSVQEASELLGYLIDYGPLFSIKSNHEAEAQLVKDTKRGKLVDGKVMFLVNTFSASASEIVAATMQKYPNSLIVGSTTFGKATGQSLFSLTKGSGREPFGTLKVTDMTILKFDGSNYQGMGVVPDVMLPTYFDKSFIGESQLDYSLEHSPARSFRSVTTRSEPTDSLNIKSKARNNLDHISSTNKLISNILKGDHYLLLDYPSFEHPFSKLGDHVQNFDDYEIISIETNEAFIKESSRLKTNKAKDPILHEAFQIFEDWVLLTQNN